MTILQRPDYSEYTLRLASPQQEQEHWRAQYVPWHLNRTWDAQGELGIHKVFRTWALVRRDDYDGRIYSGVETYRRQAFVRCAGSEEIKDAWTYGVASVVTPEDQHRRGFATHMLKLLHYCIGDTAHLPPFPADWGSAPSMSAEDRAVVPMGIASALYSDVGSTFYELCTIGKSLPGWVFHEQENQEVVWQIQAPKDDDKEWDWLYEADMRGESAVAHHLRDVSRASLANVDYQQTLCANDPTTPMLLSFIQTRCLDSRPSDWVYSRSDEPVGVRLPSTDGQEDAIVLFTWSSGMIGPRLLITHISGLMPEQLPEALKAMDVIAHKAGVKEGWAWGLDTTSALVEKWSNIPGRKTKVGRRAEVAGHLLCVAWYGDAEERGVYRDTDMWSWC